MINILFSQCDAGSFSISYCREPVFSRGASSNELEGRYYRAPKKLTRCRDSFSLRCGPLQQTPGSPAYSPGDENERNTSTSCEPWHIFERRAGACRNRKCDLSHVFHARVCFVTGGANNLMDETVRDEFYRFRR